MDDKQIQEIFKLLTGVACVYQNDWQETVFCDIPRHHPQNPEFRKTKKQKNTKLLKIFLHKNWDKNISALIQNADLSEELQEELFFTLQKKSEKRLITSISKFIIEAFPSEYIFHHANR